ncbi:MAG TPA: DMT family transporter [Nocardioidaceae bacterium]|nr:DMT family transporter [Nocardioidaceae bacterium]
MIAVAIVAAVAAAMSNSLAAYFQQSADKRLDTGDSVPLRKVPVLIREPRWLLGQAFDISAFVCQAVALAFGALVFVEPMLVLSLPITVMVRSWSARRRLPGRVGVVGSTLAVLGISVFLGVGRPTSGGATIDLGEALELAVAVAVVLGIVLGWGRTASGNARAVAFALGAGTVYGVTAGLTKVVTGELQHGGVLAALGHWPLYAGIAAGVTGVWLTQNALKPGALAAPVAAITLTDPLVAIAIGLVWLGESVTASAWAVAVQILAVLAMVVGVVILAHQPEAASAPTGEEDDSGSGDAGEGSAHAGAAH